MLNDKKRKSISKKLSLILRHRPEIAFLTLQTGGWVRIEDLLSGLTKTGSRITRDELEEVVETNGKKRFTISECGTLIRAAQGHSVKTEIGMAPQKPPGILFHGTSHKALPFIIKEGLKPMNRQHVHLSLDTETARTVGQRHGKPVILSLNCQSLSEGGQEFFCADNGVWLTGPVSPDYLTVISE